MANTESKPETPPPGTYAAALNDTKTILSNPNQNNQNGDSTSSTSSSSKPIHFVILVTHGSFNPPHADHLKMMRACCEELQNHYRSTLKNPNVFALGFYGITNDAWLQSKNLPESARFSEKDRGEMVRRMAVEGSSTSRLYLADNGESFHSSSGMKRTINKLLKEEVFEKILPNLNKRIPEPVFLPPIHVDGEDLTIL